MAIEHDISLLEFHERRRDSLERELVGVNSRIRDIKEQIMEKTVRIEPIVEPSALPVDSDIPRVEEILAEV